MPSRISVTPAQSRQAIVTTARRHGARDVTFFESDATAAVELTFARRRVRVAVPLPAFDLYLHSPSGRRRVQRVGAAQAAYEDQRRRRWKALALLMRAKLYAVVSGARTFEQEFGADVIGGDADVTCAPDSAGGIPDGAGPDDGDGGLDTDD